MQESILRFFQSIATPFWDGFFTYVTMLGEQYFVIFVTSWIFWNYSKKDGFILGYIFVFSMLINSLAKDIARTQRPFDALKGLDSVRVHTATGFSFPSGHTQSATTLFMTLAQIFKNKTTFIGALLISLLVAFSRVYLRVHWPIDILGGFLLAIIVSFTFYPLLVKLYNNKAKFFKFLIFSLIFFYLVLLVLIILNKTFLVQAIELKNYITICAISTGFFLGFMLEEKKFPFIEDTMMWRKILRFIIGIVGTIGIYAGFKVIMPDTEIFTFIRYFLIGAWIAFIFPLIGIWLGLFRKLEKS